MKFMTLDKVSVKFDRISILFERGLQGFFACYSNELRTDKVIE